MDRGSPVPIDIRTKDRTPVTSSRPDEKRGRELGEPRDDAVGSPEEPTMRSYSRHAPRADVPSPAQRPLRACGTPYRGGNIFWLWLVADMLGYASPFWMTYRQAAQLGGQVRKGEKSTIAIFYKAYGKRVEDADTGEQSTEARRVLRSYHVFNVDQIDGLPERFIVKSEPAPRPVDADRLAQITDFFDKISAVTHHGGTQAFYSPAGDFIQLPPPEAFVDADRYGATRAHECCHWSGASHRLNREFGKRFGDDKYAAEELVAELASAIVGSEIGLPVDHLDDHASYIAHWLRILKSDPKALLTIAAKADEAANYLLHKAGRGPNPLEETEIEIGDNDDDVRADRLVAA